MATVAIGDIHGYLGPLEDLLSRVTPELQPEDTLVFLGDYIDRGPDSRGCVERIIRLRNEAKFEIVTLLGNHEQWMLRSLDDPTRHSWLVGMESLETIKSYSEEAAVMMTDSMSDLGIRLFTERVELPYEAFFDAMPPEHLRFFWELKPFHRTPDVICVHGGLSLDGVLDPSDDNVHVWGPLGFPEDYEGLDAVVYGHRDNAVMGEDGIVRPCVGTNRTYGIDTISHGVLTAMRFPDGRVFQSVRK
jgi:serine/threonine protein phosphatase 1